MVETKMPGYISANNQKGREISSIGAKIRGCLRKSCHNDFPKIIQIFPFLVKIFAKVMYIFAKYTVSHTFENIFAEILVSAKSCKKGFSLKFLIVYVFVKIVAFLLNLKENSTFAIVFAKTCPLKRRGRQ